MTIDEAFAEVRSCLQGDATDAVRLTNLLCSKVNAVREQLQCRDSVLQYLFDTLSRLSSVYRDEAGVHLSYSADVSRELCCDLAKGLLLIAANISTRLSIVRFNLASRRYEVLDMSDVDELVSQAWREFRDLPAVAVPFPRVVAAEETHRPEGRRLRLR